MATVIQILTTNYSGETAQITFTPCSGGTIDLGSQVLPYDYESENYQGSYSLYFSDFTKTCTFDIPCPTLEPTQTPTNTPTPTSTETPTPTSTEPTVTPTETETPTPSATPTSTPEMATLTIIVPPGTPSIIFDGETYTSNVTAGVVKNQQYSINSSDGTSNFWYWSGTGINLPASNSQNTIVFVTGNTATLEVNYLNQSTPTPTATPNPTPSSTPLSTPNPTATSTPTPTCTPASISDETSTMISFATNNGINYITDSSGILYEIITQGSGGYPTLSSTVNTNYIGKLMNNTTFDSGTNVSFSLNALIQGWQIGLPLIQVEGRIKLIVPSSLAYGCNGAGGSIPSNSPLYFDITLNSANNTVTPTPTSTSTQIPTSTPGLPTPTLTPTPTSTLGPVPTNTPTSTATIPISTPNPTSTSGSPTPTPTATIPEYLYGFFKSVGLSTFDSHCGNNHIINEEFYSTSSTISNLFGSYVYSDTNYTPFDGGNQWYAVSSDNQSNTNNLPYFSIQIGGDGMVNSLTYVTSCDGSGDQM